MRQKFNNGKIVVKTKGPVWSVKVEVCAALPNTVRLQAPTAKHWKIKEILN